MPAGQPDAVVWSGEVPPKIPFSSKDIDVVLDVKSLCGLPWDAEQDGVHAFRALFFPKGKVIHVPDMPGRYVVDGNWKRQEALVVVHFVEATKRLPELLLSFVDHGMASELQAGISVETLKLPLLIKKDTYESSLKVAPLDDVAGFTPISIGQAPWSIHLPKTLSNLPRFKQLKISRPSEMDAYMKSPLSSRVEALVQMAQAQIDQELKVAMRQDAGVAQRRKAALNAKLNAMQATIQERSEAYEPRLTERIFTLAGNAVVPANVDIAALHTALSSDPPPRLLRSRFSADAPRRPDPPADSAANLTADAAATGSAGTARPDTEADRPGGDPGTADHEMVIESDESEESENDNSPGKKRTRNAPDRFSLSTSDAKRQKGAKAAEKLAKASKKPKLPKAKPAGVNRAGAPWKRGPYKPRDPSSTGAAADSLKAAAIKAETSATMDKYKIKIDVLEAQVQTLTARNTVLQARLETANDTAKLREQIAVQKAQLSDANKLFTKFSEGVQMGMGRAAASGGSADDAAAAPLFTPFPTGSVPRMPML